MLSEEELDKRFSYHPALTGAKRDAHADIRHWCRGLAEQIDEAVPDGREKSLAFTHLEEVMFWGNAALARDGDDA